MLFGVSSICMFSRNHSIKDNLMNSVLTPIAVFVSTLVISYPILNVIKSGRPLLLSVTQKNFNTLVEVLSAQGQWLIPILLFSSYVIYKNRKDYTLLVDLRMLLVFIPIGIQLYTTIFLQYHASWPLSLFFTFAMIVSLGVSKIDGRYHLFSILSLCGITLLVFSEYFILMDKVNTIFKIQNVAWIILGLATVSLLKFMERPNKYVVATTLSFSILLILGTVFNQTGLLHRNMAGGNTPMLDGTNFMQKRAMDTYKLIEWMNKNYPFDAVIVEAPGKSFSNTASHVSIGTGFRSFLGWKGHLYTRNIPWGHIQERERIIKDIYTSTKPLHAYNLLKKHGIKLVVVGAEEKKRYGLDGLFKFTRLRPLYRGLVRFGGTSLYEVQY
jgi:uncharacterized membrane protein